MDMMMMMMIYYKQKIICNNHPTLHVVHISAYTKLDQLLSIHSQDIELKHNSGIKQGPKINETKYAVVVI